MNRTLNKEVDLLLYYQCILAIGAVFTFFSKLDVYLADVGIAPAPKILVFVFGIASTPLLFSIFSRLKYFSLSLFSWCSGYILVSLLSFLLFLSSAAAHQELESRILSVLFIIIMFLVFSGYYIVHLWTRRAVCFVVLMSVFNNIYEMFNPLVFNALNKSNRPAGFYINPNESGCALILGMIFSVGMLSPRYRVPFVTIIGLGVLATFSRGAILSWFIVVIILIITRVIPRSQLYWVIGIGMIILGLLSMFGDILNLGQMQDFGWLNENILGRVEWFQNPSTSEDSAGSRLDVAVQAWQMFAEHPLLGNGIGSTLELSVGISTHNMYLYFMADHGILGAFILPLLVYAVTLHTRAESKYVGLAFAIFVLFWGFFSHTILSDRYTLMMFSLMAAMTVMSQIEQRSQVRHKS